MNEPVRAVWVTRFDYHAPQDVQQIMENCRQAGFNAVVFQVRGNGTVFYKSNLEPWADELGGADPGWDPLQVAIDEAHARGLDLHAWVNVMPAWRGPREPNNPEQLYHKHPDWFWYDAQGNREPLVHEVGSERRPWYVSVNPCLPEVRAYLVDVFNELAANYDIDGLHMDYIRFPNEPVVARERIPDYPRDARTLELYRRATGKAPDDDPNAWNAWRCDCVTTLVRQIRDGLRRVNPDAVLTASVGAEKAGSLAHFRDDRRWARERLIDGAFPMNYVDDPNVFGERIDSWTKDTQAVPVIPGLWFGRHPGKTTEEAAEQVRQQIQIAREKTGNFCVFSYAGLFDSVERDPLSGNETRRHESRAKRREVLVPYLQLIAQQDEGPAKS